MKEIQHILQSQDLTTNLMNEGFRHRFYLESQIWMEVRGSWKSLPYVQQIIVDSWISVGVSQLIRAALTNCHRLCIIKKWQKFNSHSSCGQKSDLIGLVRAFFQVTDFLHPYMVEAAGKLCGVSFLMALIPLMKAPSHLITSQRPHLLTPPPLGVKIPAHEFYGDTNIQFRTQLNQITRSCSSQTSFALFLWHSCPRWQSLTGTVEACENFVLYYGIPEKAWLIPQYSLVFENQNPMIC